MDVGIQQGCDVSNPPTFNGQDIEAVSKEKIYCFVCLAESEQHGSNVLSLPWCCDNKLILIPTGNYICQQWVITKAKKVIVTSS